MPRGGKRPGAGTKKGAKRGQYLTAKKRKDGEPIDITEYAARMKSIIEQELNCGDRERELRMFRDLKDYFFQKQPLAVDQTGGGPVAQFLIEMPAKEKDPAELGEAVVIDTGQLGPSPLDTSASDDQARAGIHLTRQGADSRDTTAPENDDNSDNPGREPTPPEL